MVNQNKIPKVTVLTTVYNGEAFIKETIESLLNQTFKDFEHIIVNDNSSDNTVKIINSFKDPRIKLITNKENQGTYKSANIGLDAAKGKYIARLDADDISLPNRLEKQYEFLEKNSEYKLIGAWGLNIDEIGSIISEKKRPVKYEEILATMFFGTPVIHSACMFDREFVKKLGNYSAKERKSEDFELYLKVIKAGAKIYNLSEYLIFYRIHGNSITSTQFDEQERISQQFICQYAQEILNFSISPEDIKLVRRTLVNTTGINKSEKIRLLKFCKKLVLKLKQKYSDKMVNEYSKAAVCELIVDKILTNKIFRKLARVYIFNKLI